MPPSRRSRSGGWLPRQHGAWFMITVPFAVGLSLHPDETWPVLALFGCWLSGYLAFNAATLWLKAPSTRRAAHQPPLLVYAAVAGVLGVVTLALFGPSLLWWGVVLGPMLAGALWLAAQRRERVLLSGLLTIGAASLMTLVVRFPDPAAFVAAEASTRLPALLATGLVFAYQGGTVFYVKTMIRERGDSGWLAASLAWHTAATIAAAVLALGGRLSAAWAVFFAATVARAWFMPQAAKERPVRPAVVGFLEVAFSTVFVLLAFLA